MTPSQAKFLRPEWQQNPLQAVILFLSFLQALSIAVVSGPGSSTLASFVALLLIV